MKVTEIRLVKQQWYETDTTKTGWDSYGWEFIDNGAFMTDDWTITAHLRMDKFGNPTIGIAERETIVNL